MSAIFKREFKTRARSIQGLIFISAFFLVTSLSVIIYNFNSGNSEIQTSLSNLTIFGTLLLPLLTADLFCSDKAQGADKLYASLPVSRCSVITAKYLSALCILAIPMSILLVLPIIFSLFGNVNFLASYLSVLGYFFFNMAIIAILFFISFVSKNYIVSMITSYASLVLLYLIGLPSVLFRSGTFLRSLFDTFSVFTQFNIFVFGFFDISVIFLYLSITAIFILLTIGIARAKGENK